MYIGSQGSYQTWLPGLARFTLAHLTAVKCCGVKTTVCSNPNPNHQVVVDDDDVE